MTHYNAELLQGQSYHLIGRIPVADREGLGLIGTRGHKRTMSVLYLNIIGWNIYCKQLSK